MTPHFLFRLKRWSQHPPSRRRMYLILGVVAGSILIASLEHYGLWPDALTADRAGLRGVPR